jgi:hypothetical protein
MGGVIRRKLLILLPQAIPDSKKTPKWVEGNLDRMEQIGIKQLHKNINS